MIDDKLVAKSPLIFEGFRVLNGKSGRGKNEILKASGSKDKPIIFKTIGFLKEGKLLDYRQAEMKGIKEIINLTSLGKDFLDLTTDIYLCNNAYKTVDNKLSEYLLLMEERSHPSFTKLLHEGWTNEELDSFEEVVMSLLNLRNIYLRNISSALLHRYFTILSKFKMNYIANAVLVKIVVDGISNILDSGTGQNVLQSSIYRSSFEDLQVPVLKDIKYAYKGGGRRISNRFTSKEISELMSSLVCILKPSHDKFYKFADILSDMEKEKNRIKSNRKTYKKYSRVAGGKTLLSEEEIEQLEHNGQWEQVKAETLKRHSQFAEKGAECALYNLEELAKVHMNCLKRYGDYLGNDNTLAKPEEDKPISP